MPLSADLQFRGLWHQEAGTGLRDVLDHGRLTAYVGFDPTADSLHVGNLLQMCLLRRLQTAGHRPIAVAGGVTGMIGDPGGKSEERNLLDEEQLRANLSGIRPQLERFVDLDGPGGGLLLDNADWLKPLSLVDFLRQTGKHITVNDMVKKDSVRDRLDSEHGISYTEFSYMLLQALDFLHLYDQYGCTLQMGGSDQWGNITAGIELVRKVRRAQVYGLTSPLVTKADGTKFGKTETGTVWLDARRTTPFALYQFFVRTDDEAVGRFLRFFTFLDAEQIAELDQAVERHPEKRRAQRALAHEVCVLVHGEHDTERAEAAAAALYSEQIAELDEQTLLEVCADAPTSTWGRADIDGGLTVVDALARSKLCSSKTQARTTIGQGGAYVNNRRVDDPDAKLTQHDLLFGRYVVLRRGRRDYHLVRFE